MKILIVEDEHKIANSIKKGLEQEKYSVDICFTGNDGYDFASTDDYDVIILDRMLPGIDGIEIVKKLREKNIQTPILFLTAKGQIEDKVLGLNAGADDYLVKPFSFSELLARIKALSRRPKKNTGTILRAGELTLDTISFEVKRKNNEIYLSKKEYSILEYLMQNKGRVLNKDQILNHVWNYDSEVFPNSVEVYVKHIRTKLGKPDLLKTIRGFGYKID